MVIDAKVTSSPTARSAGATATGWAARSASAVIQQLTTDLRRSSTLAADKQRVHGHGP